MAKVLVIDDSGFQRKRICAMITSLGHETTQASDGKAALEVLSGESFDCIFCDLLMPGMDGYAFVCEAKKLNMRIPIVILTADKQETTLSRIRELGVVEVLNKPPKENEIQKIIKYILSKNTEAKCDEAILK